MKTSLSFLSALMILLVSEFISAQNIDIPYLQSRVTDLCELLSEQEKFSLEKRMEEFEEQNGGQIALLILPTTGDETIEEYSIRLAELWQIGREDTDDGLILIVAMDDRKVRLEVGYGIEHLIPDALVAQIIEEDIVPKFKNGDFYGGISAGLSQSIAYLEGQLVYDPPKTDIESVTDAHRKKIQTPLGMILLGAIVILAFAFFVVMWKTLIAYLIFFALSVIIFISAYFYLEQNPVVVSIIKYLSWGIVPVLIIKLLWEGMILTGWVKRSKSRPVYLGSSSSGSNSVYSYSNRRSSYSSSGSSYFSGSSYSGSRFKGAGGSFGGGGASGSW